MISLYLYLEVRIRSIYLRVGMSADVSALPDESDASCRKRSVHKRLFNTLGVSSSNRLFPLEKVQEKETLDAGEVYLRVFYFVTFVPSSCHGWLPYNMH